MVYVQNHLSFLLILTIRLRLTQSKSNTCKSIALYTTHLRQVQLEINLLSENSSSSVSDSESAS